MITLRPCGTKRAGFLINGSASRVFHTARSKIKARHCPLPSSLFSLSPCSFRQKCVFLPYASSRCLSRYLPTSLRGPFHVWLETPRISLSASSRAQNFRILHPPRLPSSWSTPLVVESRMSNISSPNTFAE